MTAYVQRSRKKGARLPPNTICCTRPGRWGNDYKVTPGSFGFGWDVTVDGIFLEFHESKDSALRSAVECYAADLSRSLERGELNLTELSAADNLSCYCAPGAICHVQDVLIPAVEQWKKEHTI